MFETKRVIFDIETKLHVFNKWIFVERNLKIVHYTIIPKLV